jgi:H2-forming N5,N10-methylenetetrahydromethanopterin dehydrogenase-like enzyme
MADIMNWFELENSGVRVESKLIEAAKKMEGYYNILLTEFGIPLKMAKRRIVHSKS